MTLCRFYGPLWIISVILLIVLISIACLIRHRVSYLISTVWACWLLILYRGTSTKAYTITKWMLKRSVNYNYEVLSADISMNNYVIQWMYYSESSICLETLGGRYSSPCPVPMDILGDSGIPTNEQVGYAMHCVRTSLLYTCILYTFMQVEIGFRFLWPRLAC